MGKVLAIVLWAWVPFCGQPLWGQAPSGGVEASSQKKQQTGLTTDHSKNDQRGTKDAPFVVDAEGHQSTPAEAGRKKDAADPKDYVDRWTFYLAFANAGFTFVLMLTAIGGVRAALKTLRAIERQADLMNRQADLMQSQAMLMEREATVSKKALVLAQRPRISVRVFYFSHDTGVGGCYFSRNSILEVSICSGQFYIQNSGGTDATIQEVYCETYVAARLPMKRPYEGKAGLKNEMVLRPGESYPCDFRPPIQPLDHAAISRLVDAKLNFYVLGNIHYTDDLGIYRITNFCRRYDVKQDRFMRESDPDYENEA
jgi:hypothetical protein